MSQSAVQQNVRDESITVVTNSATCTLTKYYCGNDIKECVIPEDGNVRGADDECVQNSS